MGAAISEVLPFAIGAAISPVPIIAVILVLFSARARVNSLAFLAGWVLGIAIVSIAIYAIANARDVDSDSEASDAAFWIKLVLGILLVLLAVQNWRKDAPTEPAAQPKWMASIDSLTPTKAAGLGLVLSGLNPKNITLSLAAGGGLAQAGVSGSEAAVGLAVFITVASAGIAVPVVFALVGGDHAARVLDGWRAWLSEHTSALMAVLFLVFGVLLFS